LLNVNSNQLNQSKIKNIEDGAKGSGFFFFFYCKRRSGACCVVGFSCSKLRSQTSSGVCCVAAASSHAPELTAATQQAGAREAPELATLQQQASSGTGDPPELVALQQQASSEASEYCGMEIGFGRGKKMVVRWFHILSSIKIGIKHVFIYCGYF